VLPSLFFLSSSGVCFGLFKEIFCTDLWAPGKFPFPLLPACTPGPGALFCVACFLRRTFPPGPPLRGFFTSFLSFLSTVRMSGQVSPLDGCFFLYSREELITGGLGEMVPCSLLFHHTSCCLFLLVFSRTTSASLFLEKQHTLSFPRAFTWQGVIPPSSRPNSSLSLIRAADVFFRTGLPDEEDFSRMPGAPFHFFSAPQPALPSFPRPSPPGEGRPSSFPVPRPGVPHPLFALHGMT